MRIAIRTLGELLITLGALLMLFLLWQLWWTDVEANAESRGILESTRAVFAAEATVTGSRAAPGEADAPPPPLGAGPSGVAVAIIHIPSNGETRPVMDGVELGILNQGVVGAYPQSEDPGQISNFAVAGHRATYGRPMWNVTELSQSDPIVVETKDDYFIYRFDRTQIVTHYQTEVIADVPGDHAAIATEAWMGDDGVSSQIQCGRTHCGARCPVPSCFDSSYCSSWPARWWPSASCGSFHRSRPTFRSTTAPSKRRHV